MKKDSSGNLVPIPKEDTTTTPINIKDTGKSVFGTPIDVSYQAITDKSKPVGTRTTLATDDRGNLLYVPFGGDSEYPTGSYITVPQTHFQRDLARQNKFLIDALNQHKFYVDPYRSIHYDALCIPAYIYNLKKERQIDCMYLRCLQNQENLASPMVRCQGNYKVNKCLYLDSAEYIIGGQKTWDVWIDTLGDSFISAGIGFAIGLGYRQYCRADYVPGGFLKGMRLGGAGALKATICGLSGSAFALREIIDAFKNPYSMAPKVNGKSLFGSDDDTIDYCKGLDYAETYGSAEDIDSGDGWYGGE
jgi:hypothetical protein